MKTTVPGTVPGKPLGTTAYADGRFPGTNRTHQGPESTMIVLRSPCHIFVAAELLAAAEWALVAAGR